MNYLRYLLAKTIRNHRESVVDFCSLIISTYDDLLWKLEFEVEPLNHDFE